MTHCPAEPDAHRAGPDPEVSDRNYPVDKRLLKPPFETAQASNARVSALMVEKWS